jgi:hypothetical protein
MLAGVVNSHSCAVFLAPQQIDQLLQISSGFKRANHQKTVIGFVLGETRSVSMYVLISLWSCESYTEDQSPSFSIILTICCSFYITVPDYYEIIEKPIAINDILRKCRAKLYSNLQEFNADWQLMFANARKFNGDDSWVVEDAQALEKELERVLKKNGFTEEHVPTSKKKKKLRIKLSLKSNG